MGQGYGRSTDMDLTPLAKSLPATQLPRKSSEPAEKDSERALRRKQELLDYQRRLEEMTLAERASLSAQMEDAQIRRFHPNLLVPSWLHGGEEAQCVDCRDLGWLRKSSVAMGMPDSHVQCHCRALRHADRRMSAIVGEEMSRAYTFASFHLPMKGAFDAHNAAMQKAVDATRAWVEGGQPILILVGVPGCGKSHLALAGVRAYAEAGWPVAYWQVPQYLSLQKASYGMEDMREAANAAWRSVTETDILALDDYGLERGTDWAVEQMEEIIVLRYQKRMRTIITSNGLGNATPRLRSRFNDPLACVLVECTGAQDIRPLLGAA